MSSNGDCGIPGVMNHDLSPQQELGWKSALNCVFKGTSTVS